LLLLCQKVQSNAQDLWISFSEVRAKGVPSRVSDRQVTEQARAADTGREGMPVLSVVNEDGTTEAGSLIDETPPWLRGCPPRGVERRGRHRGA
jgi:hypothetical protein